MRLFFSSNKPDLTLVDESQWGVKLPTGRVINLADVTIDADGLTFRYGSFDVTGSLTRSQKNAFDGYDVAADNARLSDSKRVEQGLPPVEVGSTSFFGNVASEFADDAAGVRKFVTGEGQGLGFNLKTLILAAVILGGLWLLGKIAAAGGIKITKS